MRQFLIKTSVLLLLAALLFVGIVLVLCTVPRISKPLRELPLGRKINLDTCDILICGDSRADEQLAPEIFYKKTGLNTLNIAQSVWDLYSVSKCLLAGSVSNKLLVISTSSFQTNDGAIDQGYLGLDSYAALSFSDRCKLYHNKPKDFFQMQTDLFIHAVEKLPLMRSMGHVERRMNADYYKRPCSPPRVDKAWLHRHPWYKAPSSNGIKQRLMLSALQNLSKLKNCHVFIFNGPVCSDFYNLATESGVMKIEEDFDAFMATACGRYNFTYYSFIKDSTLRNNSLYADPQHFCEAGAEVFSSRVCNLLISNGLILPTAARSPIDIETSSITSLANFY
jgi:hypothetical protein